MGIPYHGKRHHLNFEIGSRQIAGRAGGEVKAFTNFRLPVPSSVDVSRYGAVIVWCGRFSEFITVAALQ